MKLESILDQKTLSKAIKMADMNKTTFNQLIQRYFRKNLLDVRGTDVATSIVELIGVKPKFTKKQTYQAQKNLIKENYAVASKTLKFLGLNEEFENAVKGVLSDCVVEGNYNKYLSIERELKIKLSDEELQDHATNFLKEMNTPSESVASEKAQKSFGIMRSYFDFKPNKENTLLWMEAINRSRYVEDFLSLSDHITFKLTNENAQRIYSSIVSYGIFSEGKTFQDLYNIINIMPEEKIVHKAYSFLSRFGSWRLISDLEKFTKIKPQLPEKIIEENISDFARKGNVDTVRYIMNLSSKSNTISSEDIQQGYGHIIRCGNLDGLLEWKGFTGEDIASATEFKALECVQIERLQEYAKHRNIPMLKFRDRVKRQYGEVLRTGRIFCPSIIKFRDLVQSTGIKPDVYKYCSLINVIKKGDKK